MVIELWMPATLTLFIMRALIHLKLLRAHEIMCLSMLYSTSHFTLSVIPTMIWTTKSSLIAIKRLIMNINLELNLFSFFCRRRTRNQIGGRIKLQRLEKSTPDPPLHPLNPNHGWSRDWLFISIRHHPWDCHHMRQHIDSQQAEGSCVWLYQHKGEWN